MTLQGSRQFARQLTTIACLALLAGCGGKVQKSHSVGSVRLQTLASGLNAASVASVQVVVQGTGISDQLALTSQGWTGVIGEIPIGTQTLLVTAYDNTSTEIFWNGAGGTSVTINEGLTTTADILLQQFSAPAPFSDTAPVINSVTATSTAVGPGDTVTLIVDADSPVSAPLTYLWSAVNSSDTPVGGFSSTSLATTQWTAPGTQDTYTISIQVSDPSGAYVGVSLTISDSTTNQFGSANINVTFNVWPVVTSFVASPNRIDLSQTTNLTLVASSPSGDTLSYAWSDAGCGGSFNNNSATPIYTAPSMGPAGYPASATCTLTATISDGLGGTNTAALTIQIGPVQNAEGAPVFTAAQQSQQVALTTDTVQLSATANDPQSSGLTFGWSFSPVDATAALGMATNTATTSSNTFIPGTGFGSYTVTVTATDGVGLATSYSWTVDVYSTLCAPQSGLVGCWLFDGNAIDSSGNGTDGTVSGATLTTDENMNANSAYAFNGSANILINDPSLPQGAGTRTISIWFESSAMSDQLFMSWGTDTTAEFSGVYGGAPGGDLAFVGGFDDITTAIPVLDGNWHNVIVTYDGTTITIWLDGSNVDSGSPMPTLNTVGTTLNVGNSGVNAVTGSVDDIRVWNRVLSNAEITGVFSAGPK